MNFCGHAHLSSAMRAAVAQRIEQPFDSGAGRRFESYQRLAPLSSPAVSRAGLLFCVTQWIYLLTEGIK